MWDTCLQGVQQIGIELLSKGRISVDDVEASEPYLILGLPTLAVEQVARRSARTDVFIFSSGLIVSEERRPHNPFADLVWDSGCGAKSAWLAAEPVGEQDLVFLEQAALQEIVARREGERPRL